MAAPLSTFLIYPPLRLAGAKNTLSDFPIDGCLINEMQPQSDAQLLRDYSELGKESAFAEIVTRHTDLVYSAALRQVYSPDLARDVTQSVFTDLARKARSLSVGLNAEASLVGWLYRATRFAARDLYRNETRRTQRERLAMEQLQPESELTPDWNQLSASLDDAMSDLDDFDREAILLRYFKNHDLRSVGAALGISDDAAQKRVSRAVERLREILTKRGIAVGASGLIVVISANAVQAAPVGLALTISTAAALTGTAATSPTLIATAAKTIAMTTLQKTLVTVTIALLAGAGAYEIRRAAKLREQVQILQRQQGPLTAQIRQLQREHDDATSLLVSMADENAKEKRNSGELLKLRGEVGTLQLLASEATQRARKAEENLAAELSSKAQFTKHETATVRTAKDVGLAIRLFSDNHNNSSPTNIVQIAEELGGSFEIGGISLSSFELKVIGEDRLAHPNTVELRERLARQAPDGTWRRIYLFADGSVQIAISNDGNFDAWEKANTYSPLSN